MNEPSSLPEKFQQLATSMRVVIQMINEIESEVTSQMEASDAATGTHGSPSPMGPWGVPPQAPEGQESGPWANYGSMPPWMWPPAWMGWPMMMPPWAPNWMWGGAQAHAAQAPVPPQPPQGAVGGKWTWNWDTTQPPYATDTPR